MIEESFSCSSGELYREGERPSTQIYHGDQMKEEANEGAQKEPSYDFNFVPGENYHHKQK